MYQEDVGVNLRGCVSLTFLYQGYSCTEKVVSCRSSPVHLYYNLLYCTCTVRSRPEFDFVEVTGFSFLFLCAVLGTFRLTVPYILICPWTYQHGQIKMYGTVTINVPSTALASKNLRSLTSKKSLYGLDRISLWVQ